MFIYLFITYLKIVSVSRAIQRPEKGKNHWKIYVILDDGIQMKLKETETWNVDMPHIFLEVS
jgi:hypothetical protein